MTKQFPRKSLESFRVTFTSSRSIIAGSWGHASVTLIGTGLPDLYKSSPDDEYDTYGVFEI